MSQHILILAEESAKIAHRKQGDKPWHKYNLGIMEHAIGKYRYVPQLMQATQLLLFGRDASQKMHEVLARKDPQLQDLPLETRHIRIWLYCAYERYFALGRSEYNNVTEKAHLLKLRSLGIWFPETDGHRICYLVLPNGTSTRYFHRPSSPAESYDYSVE